MKFKGHLLLALVTGICITTSTQPQADTIEIHPGIPQVGSPLVTSGPCIDIAREIFEDIQRYPINIKEQPLPWKDVTSIINQLGQGQVQDSEITIFHWHTYNVQMRDGKIISQGGSLGDKKLPRNPTLEQITKILGKPTDSITTKHIQRAWTCQDTTSSITVQADGKGQLTQVDVTACYPDTHNLGPHPQGCSSTAAKLGP